LARFLVFKEIADCYKQSCFLCEISLTYIWHVHSWLHELFSALFSFQGTPAARLFLPHRSDLFILPYLFAFVKRLFLSSLLLLRLPVRALLELSSLDFRCCPPHLLSRGDRYIYYSPFFPLSMPFADVFLRKCKR
jgi:hypothetical protein